MNLIKNLTFKKVYPMLKPGDVLFHHPEIIHGSPKNKSKFDRIGLVISYKTISSKIDKNKLYNYRQKLKKSLSKIYY